MMARKSKQLFFQLSDLEERLEFAQEKMTSDTPSSLHTAHITAYDVMKEAERAFSATSHQMDRSYRNDLDRVILEAILVQYQCFKMDENRTSLEQLADIWDRWRLYRHAKLRVARLENTGQRVPYAWREILRLRHHTP